MEVMQTKLAGCVIIKPKFFDDERGFFSESYHSERYSKLCGIKENFVQDNHSRSTKGVLRGLHFQVNRPQGKLVSVTSGVVFDVAVDLRVDSPTFGEVETIILSGENHLQFYVPPGFAHGFLVLSETADFQYKCTDYYDPSNESGIIWNDCDLKIDWPIENPILSCKDSSQQTLEEYKNKFRDK
jgi:dTDP-4-dehydrorhamnose 3,5-epimerase